MNPTNPTTEKECSGCQYLVVCLGDWPTHYGFASCQHCDAIAKFDEDCLIIEDFVPPVDCWRFKKHTVLCQTCLEEGKDFIK